MATQRHCLAPSGNTSSASLSSGPIWQLTEQIGTYRRPRPMTSAEAVRPNEYANHISRADSGSKQIASAHHFTGDLHSVTHHLAVKSPVAGCGEISVLYHLDARERLRDIVER